ncbi:MAG: cysteine-rich CWC family protein [Gammaproteobacteria bacterium]
MTGVTLGAPVSKRCTACGAAFSCGAQSDRCWCQEYPLLPAEQLRPDADCLCPRCLGARTGALVSASASTDRAG